MGFFFSWIKGFGYNPSKVRGSDEPPCASGNYRRDLPNFLLDVTWEMTAIIIIIIT